MKILITSVCFVLVVAQLGYVFLVDLDGNLDEGRFPGWMMGGTSEVSDAAAKRDAVTGDEFDSDDHTQDPSELAPVALPAERIEELGRATAVRILDANDHLVGSGVVVAKQGGSFDLVTAFHVIDGVDRFAIEFFPASESAGTTISQTCSAATIIRSDPALDLARLRVVSLIQPTESVAVAAAPGPSMIDNAWSVDCTRPGTPLVSKIKNVTRRNARRSQEDVGVSYWRLGQESSPGMSGSALLDDRGRLIGVASGNSEGRAYYCGTEALQDFIERRGVHEDRLPRGGGDVPDVAE